MCPAGLSADPGNSSGRPWQLEATPTVRAPGGVPDAGGPAHAAAVPLSDSRDWKRWVVVLPLIGFVVALGAYAMRRA